MITKALTQSDSSKFYERRMWSLALMFTEGMQQLRWDNNIGRYLNGKKEDHTSNRLLSIYRNIAARLSTNYPSITVLPATPSNEDIIKAKMSGLALDYYWFQDGMKGKLASVVKLLLTCGNAGLHTYFDAKTESVTTAVVDPFNLLFEPGVESPEQSDWIAVADYLTKEQLKETYPDTNPEDIDDLVTSDPSEARLFGKPSSQSDTLSDRVRVYEVYYRNGDHQIVAGNLTLWKGVSNLPKIPVELVRYTDIPKRLWGISLLGPLLETQVLYNRVSTQIGLNVELMGNPKWLIPKNAGISAGQITNKPGEKIFYNGAAKEPREVTGAPLPAYVENYRMQLQQEMQDIAGVHATSLGKRAVGINSGKAIEALATLDSSQLQLTMDDIERACMNMSTSVLLLMREHYTKPKMMRMFDNFGKVMFHTVRSTELVDEPEVFFQAGSLFRSEAQDRDAKVLDMLKAGLISKEDALKELNFSTGGKAYLKQIADLAHAKDILQAILEGKAVEIFRTDNLDAFQDVFEEFMRDTGEEGFYSQPEEIQEYIRDVYVAVAAAINPEAGATLENMKVFPSTQAAQSSPAVQAAAMVTPESDEAQAQQAALNAESIGVRQEGLQAQQLLANLQEGDIA